MKDFRSKYKKSNLSSHAKIISEARSHYHKIQKRTPRRQAYVRSAYFSKDKVFINQFWDHVKQKRSSDQVRRLQFYLPSLDLIRNTKQHPETIYSNADKEHALHRFKGVTIEGYAYYVQVKENKRTNRKDFMSCFPAK